ncbi:hypothetical protein ACH5RR_024181 [Cinchona calisaya]|uniref:Uncharacterized protein n=1 Tax=Cinchona calisaya TaxID=153742 RepID=A0ABD2ZDV6_9GENT
MQNNCRRTSIHHSYPSKPTISHFPLSFLLFSPEFLKNHSASQFPNTPKIESTYLSFFPSSFLFFSLLLFFFPRNSRSLYSLFTPFIIQSLFLSYLNYSSTRKKKLEKKSWDFFHFFFIGFSLI